MSRNEAEKRIIELRKEIEEHSDRYYKENNPSISDYEFDLLLKELQGLEKEFPDLDIASSPTHHVGSDLKENSDFKQYAHKYAMLSLSNTYSIEDLEDFEKRISKSLNSQHSYACEPKYDGTAICLTYSKGKLLRALSRGDGSIGDDVTDNIKQIKDIPHQLSGKDIPEEFEIRGEIYMPFKAFQELNEERIEEGESPFANPRNAASGSLKLHNPKLIKKRGLRCSLYHILGENLKFETHSQAMERAKSWGLPISNDRKLCKNIEEIEDYINYWDKERKSAAFPIDGMVIKVDQLALQKELGYTSKFPKWAVAYKFQAERAVSPILSIDYQVGRTGAITPVANLEPVQLSGTIVKRASLNNYEQILNMDIHIGDYVYVEKGGEIIPKICGVDLAKRPANAVKAEFPKFCPDCKSPLVRAEGEAKFYCPNTQHCPTQIKAGILHFCSRKAMNIVIGEAGVDQLYNSGFVNHPSDLYGLKVENLLQLESWKLKSADNLLKSIEKSKSSNFAKVLYALGIRNVGEVTAKSLAKHFQSMQRIIEASQTELEELKDVGGIIAKSIYEFCHDEQALAEIKKLQDFGLNFQMTAKSDEASATIEIPALQSKELSGKAEFQDKSIVISGNFSISRNQMKDFIENIGARNSSAISAKTDFLLSGTKSGEQKLKKAKELNVKIITEEDFYQILVGEKRI